MRLLRTSSTTTSLSGRPFQPERMGGRLPPLLSQALLDELAALLRQCGLQQRNTLPWEATQPDDNSVRLLILEDNQARAVTWHPVAQELAQGLSQRGIPLYFGHFRAIPGIVHDATGPAWPLLSLDAQRHRCMVLVFSDSQGLRQDRHFNTLRQFRGWPMLAWMELRETRSWDHASARVAACGLPLYEANATALRQVFMYFAAGHAGSKNPAREIWHDAPQSGQQRLSVSVSRILAEAETWAQACAMLPPPLGLALAQNIREQFYPQVSAMALGRLLALPEVQLEGLALTFSPRLLALLRSGFACQNWHIQERVLAFMQAQVARHCPTTPGIDWYWYAARLRLEAEPDVALPQLHQLAQRPDIGAQVRADLARLVVPLTAGAGSTARIPMRIKPQTRQGLRLLLQLSPDCGISYAELQPLRYQIKYTFDCVRAYFNDSPVQAHIHPKGETIISISADNRAALWRAGYKNPQPLVCADEYAEEGMPLWQRLGAAGKLLCCFYPDGSRAVTVMHDNCVRVWDLHSYEAVYILKHHALSLRGLAISTTGQVLGLNGDGQVWDIFKGRPLLRLSSHRRILNSLALAPDNRCVLCASADGSARLWELRSGQLLQVLHGHSGSVEDAAFSPDGRYVVTASRDRSARVWETHSGKCVHILRAHRKALRQALFSPQGHYIVTVSRDKRACVWRAADGHLLQILENHRAPLTCAAFSADGARLLTADENGDIYLWDHLHLHPIQGVK
jgi:WD40 repeat protein